MKQVKNLSQEIQAIILTLAAEEFNFFGKRTRDTRLATAEKVLRDSSVDLISEVECADLVEWLIANKPVKATTAKKAKVSQEPIEPTFTSQAERDSDMPILEAGLYVISSAQNNTVPAPAFNALQSFAMLMGANLLLMPIKYTTTLEQRERKTPHYHADLNDYMITENSWIGGRGAVRLAVMANIVPTAKKPINTAVDLNNGEGLTLVASPKAQTQTLQRPKNGGVHRWAYTTRSITARHYTESRAGDTAANSHSFGGVLIHVHSNGMIEHTEIVISEDGQTLICGLDAYDFRGGECIPANIPPAAIVLGDLHCEKMCDDSFGRSIAQITETQAPVVVIHDTLDHMSRNHHNISSSRFTYLMGNRTVLDDLTECINYINQIAEIETVNTVFMVRSNHDLALDQWLDSNHYNPATDGQNQKTYHFLNYLIRECMDSGQEEEINAFKIACENIDELPRISDKIVYGQLDESYSIAGVEAGQHGHLGSGGARGSLQTFIKLRMPTVTGHTHSPARDGVNLVVGVTGSLEMGYNKGISMWDRANALIWDSGLTNLQPTYDIGENQY